MRKNGLSGTIRLGLVAGALAIAALSGLAFAGQEPAEPPAAGAETAADLRAPLGAITEYLDLTAEQKDAWSAIFRDTAAKVHPLREQLRAKEQALRELLASAAPDPAAVGTLVLEGKGLRDQIAALEDAKSAALLATLTPDQVAKVDAVAAAAELCPLVPAFKAIRFF